MEAFLSYGFLQRALIAGVFVALACAMLGVFLILRRDSMIGHGLSHVAFAGIAIGLLLNIFPMTIALIVAVIGALCIMGLKERSGLYSDTAIAIFSSVGFALGILVVTISQRFNVDLFGYLFGDILTIDISEVVLSICLAAAVVLTVVLYYQRFMYMTFDRESARVSGIRVKRLDMLLSVLTAITVVLGMKLVGILLVSALLVIPAAAGLQLASSFKQAIGLSSLVALVSVVLGLSVSFYLDFPASGSIVLLSFVLFSLFFLVKRLRRA
jgi:zinc transport system permease protein